MESTPFFSIIIPTRNRPELFEKALRSVVAQRFENKEIIVVNDGTDDVYIEQYDEILKKQPDDIAFYSLVQRKNGHGQSYSMNHGAQHANGKYLCFLDDDDEWTDPRHLENAYAHLKDEDTDLYYTNQEAYYKCGKRNTNSVWLEDLIGLTNHINADIHEVDAKFLLRSNGFAHLNCTIFRADFYKAIGGMDENIRYECDRDIYIRSIDNAKKILFSTAFVSMHNIPDNQDTSNMSTLVGFTDKKLYQLRVYEKGILNCQNEDVRDSCINGKMYQLKHLAEKFHQSGQKRMATLYAKQALAINYTPKWHLFTMYLQASNLLRR